MRPTEHGFVGPLAGELEEYIRFKASMGRHGATRVQVLRSFDRHCLEHLSLIHISEPTRP